MNFLRVIYRRASHAAASLPLCFARIKVIDFIPISKEEIDPGPARDQNSH